MPRGKTTATTPTTPMTPAQIQKLIADSVAAALETQAAAMAQASSSNRPTGENEVTAPRKCSYSSHSLGLKWFDQTTCTYGSLKL